MNCCNPPNRLYTHLFVLLRHCAKIHPWWRVEDIWFVWKYNVNHQSRYLLVTHLHVRAAVFTPCADFQWGWAAKPHEGGWRSHYYLSLSVYIRSPIDWAHTEHSVCHETSRNGDATFEKQFAYTIGSTGMELHCNTNFRFEHTCCTYSEFALYLLSSPPPQKNNSQCCALVCGKNIRYILLSLAQSICSSSSHIQFHLNVCVCSSQPLGVTHFMFLFLISEEIVQPSNWCNNAEQSFPQRSHSIVNLSAQLFL